MVHTWPLLRVELPRLVSSSFAYDERNQHKGASLWRCRSARGGQQRGIPKGGLSMCRWSVIALWLSMAAACGGGDGAASEACPAGDEGCACFSNNTCHDNLICRSRVCAQAPAAGSGGDPSAYSNGGAGAPSKGGAGGAGGGSAGNGNPAAGSGTGRGGSSAACVPQCGNRVCGADPACQTSCGTCDAGLKCVEGACQAATSLKNNGDTCAAATECASGVCEKSQVGERHCYGTAGRNEICVDAYDCDGGWCVSMTLSGAGGVCIPGIYSCYDRQVSSECKSAIVAYCQLVQFCGSQSSSSVPPEYLTDFDACVDAECSGITLSSSDCIRIVNNISSGAASCP